MRHLLDADAVIDHLKGFAPTRELIADLIRRGEQLCTCDVVIAEVLAGSHEDDRPHAEQWLFALEFLPTSPMAAWQAGRWRYDFARQGRQLPTTDCLIAATAVEHGAAVVTGNERHYPMREVALVLLPRERR